MRLRYILLLLLATAPAASAQLTPEQTLNRRDLSDVHFSPDGSVIAFTVNEPPKGDSRARHIWVLQSRSRELRQFTYSPKSEFSPRWSPDGRKLAFLSDRDGPAQIYLMATDGGESTRLTEGKNAIRSFEWSPDGKQIAFIAQDAKTDAEEKKEKDKDDARVVDRDDRQPRLWVTDLETRKPRALTPKIWEVSEARWTPHGDSLIVSATDHPEVESDTSRIFSVAATDGQMKQIAAPKGPFGGLRVSPDGKDIVYAASRVDGPSPHDLFIQSIDGGPARNLTGAALDRPVGGFIWRPDGSILAVVAAGFDSRLHVITRNGKDTSWPASAVHPTNAFDVCGDALAFVGDTATEPQEIWLSDSAGHAEQVTHFNENWKQIPLIKPEIISYKSFDGTEIEAALMKPAGYHDGAKVPLVVLVHGGPTGRWQDQFEPWGQLLAARGYAVFYPNVRGSTGYGFHFLEMNRADWGGGDFKDVMAGVDFLIAKGVADPERLAIGGWSYGGYMSAWAITQTNRFKAAMVGAGLSDLASEYGTEQHSSYDEWFYGMPYEKIEGFQKSSPITHVKNARTPTLILQGEADTTDPIGQSQQLYRGLKRYGVESEFVIYPREGHGLRETKHLLDRMNRIIAWYTAHVPVSPSNRP